MANKLTILLTSDWCDSGFGTVMKELCARLADMEIFDIHVLGWHATPNDVPNATHNKIHLHTTQFWNPADQFGAVSFNDFIRAIRPAVVISLGDPWMVEHIQACPDRKKFVWIAYIPIDRDIISQSWKTIMKYPDLLLTYSKWGEEIVKNDIPFRSIETILHGVDRTVFRPWYPQGTNEDTPHDQLMAERKRTTLGDKFKDKFIVGYLGRNQIRKNIPRTVRAFKAFNCETWIDKYDVDYFDEKDGSSKKMNAEHFCREKQLFRCDLCPAFQQRAETENSIIYLHTTRGDGSNPHDRPGIGWYIDEIAKRHDLAGRVAMTPNYNDVTHGIPRAAIAQILNCFDVHCFLTYSEGFGLPAAESIACGCPTLVTDYSSMPELVKDGGGFAIRPRDFMTFVTYENECASADIGDAADRINDVFKDSEFAAKLRKDAANNSYVPDWQIVASEFRKLILKAVGQSEE